VMRLPRVSRTVAYRIEFVSMPAELCVIA
jgi:hypothetical protein